MMVLMMDITLVGTTSHGANQLAGTTHSFQILDSIMPVRGDGMLDSVSEADLVGTHGIVGIHGEILGVGIRGTRGDSTRSGVTLGL